MYLCCSTATSHGRLAFQATLHVPHAERVLAAKFALHFTHFSRCFCCFCCWRLQLRQFSPCANCTHTRAHMYLQYWHTVLSFFSTHKTLLNGWKIFRLHYFSAVIRDIFFRPKQMGVPHMHTRTHTRARYGYTRGHQI